jgi:predicted nucleotidyltransferase component of viral defense system
MEPDRSGLRGRQNVGGTGMKVSRQRLLTESKSTGFRPEILEKAYQLLNLLNGFNSHPFLKNRFALKGGTALNLFFFDMPRLSVDIDLNYIGAVDRAVMQKERPEVERAIQDVCTREGMQCIRIPREHAGGKLRLRYESSISESGNLEADLNYMFRLPLWPLSRYDSRIRGMFEANEIPLLDIHELTAGKFAALFSRNESRDLFDVYQLMTKTVLDKEKLRLGFVLYGAMNRRDWRKIGPDDISTTSKEMLNRLFSMLRLEFIEKLEKPEKWAAELTEKVREEISIVLPFVENEREFLNRLLDHGEVDGALLTSDQEMIECIQNHPLLQWKALNVRQYRNRENNKK